MQFLEVKIAGSYRCGESMALLPWYDCVPPVFFAIAMAVVAAEACRCRGVVACLGFFRVSLYLSDDSADQPF